MPRTLVKTTTPGWFIDAADPDGQRVRKKPDDTIISLEEYEGKAASSEAKSEPKPEGKVVGNAHNQRQAAESKPERDKEAPESTLSETGKVLVGKTIEIKCSYKDENGKVCGKARRIKPQDKFQVKFCDEHQKEHRKRIKREKLKAKRKRDKQQKEASS